MFIRYSAYAARAQVVTPGRLTAERIVHIPRSVAGRGLLAWYAPHRVLLPSPAAQSEPLYGELYLPAVALMVGMLPPAARVISGPALRELADVQLRRQQRLVLPGCELAHVGLRLRPGAILELTWPALQSIMRRGGCWFSGLNRIYCNRWLFVTRTHSADNPDVPDSLHVVVYRLPLSPAAADAPVPIFYGRQSRRTPLPAIVQEVVTWLLTRARVWWPEKGEVS